MANITKLTENYIAHHPGIRDSFKNGLINYSALARKILFDMKLEKKNFDAISIACRRYYSKLKKAGTKEDRIISLLKESKLEVKNKMADSLIDRTAFFNKLDFLQNEVKKKNERLNIIEGTNTVTVITSMEFAEYIKKLFKYNVIRHYEDLAEVVIKSPDELTETVGFVAYVSSLLAENGINIIEIMSTYTDTLIIIHEKDIARTMEILKF